MVQPTQSKTVKVTISGSYFASNRDIESFEAVTGLMPRLDEDKIVQMAIKRYAPIWVRQAKNKADEPKYKALQRVRQVFVDSIEDNEEQPNAVLSYVGKNVMEMNFEELQDFASANDLSGVPLYKTGSLTHARRVAFSEYAIKVLKLEEYTPEDKQEKQNLYDYRVTGFNPARFEPIIADEEIRRSGRVLSIEESIDRDFNTATRKKDEPVAKGTGRLTMEQLKSIAQQRNVPFNKGISYDALYKKVYGVAAA